ncbi:hypothetical protein TNCV_2042791 [Trichonephila clavipes]|nr:hypothetical protein TNCV_2042791 [Trichonephila clavipes]
MTTYFPALNPMDYSVGSILESKTCPKTHKTVDSPNQLLLREWCLLKCVYCWDTYDRREIDEQKHITESQNAYFFTNDDPSNEQNRYAAFLSKRESISGESPLTFTEDTSMPYSGFKP